MKGAATRKPTPSRVLQRGILCVADECAKRRIVSGLQGNAENCYRWRFRSDRKGYVFMSSVNESRQATMDSTQVYREETFTDRKVGTIRKLKIGRAHV